MTTAPRGASTFEPPLQPWWVVVPVKGGSRAKTRLTPPTGVDHRRLARAFALDTVAAAASAVTAQRVVVVTGSPALTRRFVSWGVRVVPDPRGGLAAAVGRGIQTVLELAPGEPTAVLLGDLPALTDDALSQALRAAAWHRRSFVPDRAGTGTVLLAASRPADLRAHFGPGSAARHTRAGHVRLDLDLPRLRTDVDDSAGLAEAVCLGAGPRTAAVLAGT
jgi:2-phospho-L-lactate guanylyltransferase